MYIGSFQATELEAIVPLAKNVKTRVLLGDEKQLGPVDKYQELVQIGYYKSFFDRFISLFFFVIKKYIIAIS